MLDYYGIVTQITEVQLTSWATEIVAELKQSHIDAGQVASGDTLKAFGFEVDPQTGLVVLKIEGAEHIEFDDRGRGDGKQSPVEDLVEWIENKGLKSKWKLKNDSAVRSAAFGIAKKHAASGSYQHRTGKTWNGKSKPVSSVFSDAKIKKLNDSLTKSIMVKLESEIIEQFKV